MVQITRIRCDIATGKLSGAGTDGSVYLGVAGREFRLDSTADDYERDSVRRYTLGELVTPFSTDGVNNPQLNDPNLGFPLDTENLDRLPKYIRFEPEGSDDRWHVRSVTVSVIHDHLVAAVYTTPRNFEGLWLSNLSGKVLHLTNEIRHHIEAGAAARELAREAEEEASG